MAFREFDTYAALPTRIWTAFKLRLDKIVGKFRGESYETEKLLNISYEEDLMLAKLADALRAGIDDHAEDTAVIGKTV